MERPAIYIFFFFNDTATTEIYTLSLHDALPISLPAKSMICAVQSVTLKSGEAGSAQRMADTEICAARNGWLDRKSTRLNSSHGYISYAVFCLKKKTRDVCDAARAIRLK